MSIILILAGIVIGVQRGVYRSQSEARAKGDMSAIATALEAYKLRHGDYPWLGADVDGTELFKHLRGEEIMRGDGSGSVTMEAVTDVQHRRPLLDIANFRLNSGRTAIVDPWGNPYRYYYRNSAGTGTWNYPSFILVSAGPDGSISDTAMHQNGNLPPQADSYFTGQNLDNIVHGYEF